MIRYTKDMTPFDMAEKPSKQYFFLMPLIWAAAKLSYMKCGMKIDRSGIKGVKGPFLIIATHQGPADYSAAPLAAFPHRAMYVSDMEGFLYYGKWLYRGLGCIGKRRFVSDITVVKNMKYALGMGQSVFVFPESRHSNVGTTAYIPKNLGKLCKFMDVPVVLFTLYGSYLANPFWDELRTRKVPIEGKLSLLYSRDDLKKASADEIQKALEKGLEYNEYEYQTAKKILIKEPFRAEGLHKALYICRKCGAKYKMTSSGDTLKCSACGREFLLREDGFLEDKESGEQFVIPDWYEWERDLEISGCKKAIENGGFVKSYKVKVEALPSEKGFVNLGTGTLEMDEKEFRLSFGEGDRAQTLSFPHRSRESVQTEYDYRGVKGRGIVLSTRDCCYYVYCDAEDFNPTELQFIGEWLFQNGSMSK
ncbi:MAG: 1-acyl-sn-glycerol-3-phosphate acyltransferase [Lachnospiraceae bacterium]|nr:1-acyl-sn-glycerol-3-phosphate acyltransferase [Lachnospiraceae bacterium]